MLGIKMGWNLSETIKTIDKRSNNTSLRVFAENMDILREYTNRWVQMSA